jgi:hypothetical protein
MHEDPEIQDAMQFCIEKIKGLDRKADHNKNEALRSISLVMGCTLIAPLFLAFGEGTIPGKIVPSVLSLFASVATTWMQIRKPQQLWALYRTAHRELEYELNMFKFRAGDYENAEKPETMLAARSCEIALNVHNKWLGLVPSAESLKSLSQFELGSSKAQLSDDRKE